MSDFSHEAHREIAPPYDDWSQPAGADQHAPDAFHDFGIHHPLPGEGNFGEYEVANDGMVEVPTHETLRQPEVISGSDRGYIRSAPDEAYRLLTTSFSEGKVVPGHEPRVDDVIRCAASLAANFGTLTVQSGRRRDGIVEEYNSLTSVAPGNGLEQSLVIKAKGPLHISQFSAQTEHLATPVGVILAEPTVDIIFTKHAANERIETRRFVFGRDGAVRFEHSVDDETGFNAQPIEAEEALEYLTQNLPSVKNETGHAALSRGRMLLPEYTISTVFNDIRRNRLGHNGIDMQHAGQMKMDEFGYDTVLFVPQDYFVTGNRDGEFFSVDFPETFIPEGILECSEPRNRIEKIAHQIDGDADEQKIADTLFLAKALPAGLSNIAVLVKRNDEPARPNLMKVPTAIFDKAAAYFLQHPTTTQTAMKSYQEMCDIVGEPPTSTSIQIALEAGLLDHDQTTARSLFEDFVRPLGGTGMKAPAAQAAITQAFNTLTRLGNILRGVYSEEDMTCFRQSGTAMLADEM